MKLVLVTAACLLSGIAAAGEPPNVLLLVSDDQGWNDIGYHNAEIRTPHLDKLARTGVELDCHYVQPQCTPTRVALMTGRYPSRFGPHCCVANNVEAFPIGTLTLAGMLKSRGYATGMSGKWHLGSKPEWGPNHHGFDYSHGSLAGAIGMYDHRYRLDTPFTNTWRRNHEPLEEVGHATDLVAGEAVKWIETHADPSKPWFFYVPFHAVHTPLIEGDPHWQEVNNHIRDPERRLYASAVSHLDGAVGQIVAALDTTGQRDRTLIVFTSDNGAQVDHGGGDYPPPDPKLTDFSSNAPLRGRKTETWEGGFRVPAFANWPGRLEPRKVTAPLHVVDWAPTLAALCDYRPDQDPKWDGRDIGPLLRGEPAPEPRTIYTVWGEKRDREALRHGDWKLVRNGGREWRLFNVAEDPNERIELTADHPEIVERLMGLYRSERAKDAE